jgi:hypothetical protein
MPSFPWQILHISWADAGVTFFCFFPVHRELGTFALDRKELEQRQLFTVMDRVLKLVL